MAREPDFVSNTNNGAAPPAAACWWSVRDIARHYGLSLRLVYLAVEQGRLTAHRFGLGRGGIRIADEDRLDWEARSRQVPRQERRSFKPRQRADLAALMKEHLDL